MRRYESYKDSGIDWLGEIPAHWEVKRSKFVNKIYNGDSLNDNQKSKYQSDNLQHLAYISSKDINLNYSTIDYNNGIRIYDYQNFKVAPNNTSLICIEGGSAGRKIAFTNEAVCFVNKLACVTTLYPVNSKFVYYSLKGSLFQTQFANAISGLIGGVSISALNGFLFTIPSIDEQHAISLFLDQKCAKIDALISVKEKQIELLKERRQAVIHEAVTKGINPNVKLKDSGIDWIGEIPEHWEVVRLKYITTKIVDGAHFTPTYVDSGIPFLRVTDLSKSGIDRKIDWNNVKFIPLKEHKELIKRANPEVGDILLSKNGTIGLTRVIDWEEEFSFFVSLCLIKPVKKLSPSYFEFFFNCPLVDRQINDSSSRTSVTNLHLEKIKELTINLPPNSEQQEIVSYLDKQTFSIDKAIIQKQEQIQKLKEYKQSLINEVVTGKVRVS